GFCSAAIGAAAVFATVQLTSLARETNAPPQIKIENTPIDRDARGVTSYAPIIKRVAPSVVNIYSTRTVRRSQMDANPFFNDPFFRRFFGPDDEDNGGGNMPRGGRRQQQRPLRSQSLGSGVIVSSDGYILTANHVVEGADEVKV